MAYRLIFVDVDGTLVTSDQRVTARTAFMLARARAVGMQVALATGRTYESAKRFAEAAGANAPLVLYNGARVQDPESGRTLAEWRLNRAAAARVLREVQELAVHVSLFFDDVIYIPRWTDDARASAEKDGVTFEVVDDLLATLDRDPLKIMLIGEPDFLDGLRERLLRAFADHAEPPPALVRSEPKYLEVWSPESNKGVAAEWVASHLGYRMEEVIAFGDSLNDIALLRAAGLGVAMGNGHAEAISAADRITSSNEEEGVAAALEAILGAPD